ncbi:MAG: Minf_1886 family protein [Planctomycetota bacterium]
MMSVALAEAVNSTCYPLNAFVFVQRGLDFTVRREHGELADDYDPNDPDQPSRHISGRVLCEGLRDYAIQQYGLLAGTVLRRWRITRCEDFGHIVFAMVESGMMHKTEDDSIADFEDVFSFREAFGNTGVALG